MPEHVKGHQDDASLEREYTRLELLNIEADELADMHWKATIDLPWKPHQLIQHEGWSVWNGDKKISSPTLDNLYSAIQDPITIRYWTTPHTVNETPRLSVEGANLVDWKVSKNFMKLIPFARKRWVTKHASDNCGVSKTLQLWEYQDHDRCPRCSQPEDAEHVTQCHGHDADEIWDAHLRDFTDELEIIGSSPEVREAIVTRLQQWRYNMATTPIPGNNALQLALAEQDVIGWKNFADGLASSRWVPIQEAYYLAEQSQKKAVAWLPKILHHAHNLVWGQWDHRNDILHRVDQPRQKAARQQLDSCVQSEVLIGCHRYPPKDRKPFDMPVPWLLGRSTGYKKNWLLNVTAIRQKHLRKATNDNTAVCMPEDTAEVIKWMKTPRLR
jgi:hypothetical protein